MQTEAPAKEPCYLRSERSPVFAKYCELVYGKALNQYGTADVDQLELLLRLLGLTPDSRVLDAGCGTGQTTRYLAERSGAAFLGIDKSERAIGRAVESGDSLRVVFQVADMDALELPTQSFDAVVAIESLYFPKDLTSTVAQFRALLRPGGQMGLFFTSFGDSNLEKALQDNHLAFEAHDLTEADRKFWERSKRVAEEMRAEFAAEGNEDLLHLGETDAVLGMIEKGGHRRALYHVRRG
jgi:cyclopropane fatty-acyl-phospholipid synthase-like methyltransferase